MKTTIIKLASAALLSGFIFTGCAEHRYIERDHDEGRHHHHRDRDRDRDRDHHDNDHHETIIMTMMIIIIRNNFKRPVNYRSFFAYKFLPEETPCMASLHESLLSGVMHITRRDASRLYNHGVY